MVHREALFASDLQPSERPGAKAVNTAITDDPRARMPERIYDRWPVHVGLLRQTRPPSG